jgi:hypothetical protein
MTRREIQSRYRNSHRAELSAYNTSPEGRLLSNARNEKYRATRYVSVMLAQTKFRAKKLHLKFDLIPGDILVPTTCPVLGIPIRRGRGRTDNSPSIDRVIPSRGYIRGNVRIISFRANAIKRDASSAELRDIADYIDMHVAKPSAP